jgi:glycosyltransferase involved in cell wall biosynthesis
MNPNVQQPIKRERRLRVFTWHVHGTYLYYLTQANCDFYLGITEDRSGGYGGKSGPFPWGDNIYEIPLEEVKNTDFDVILFQSRRHYEIDQYEIFSKAQLELPKAYIEHDPPREHPTDTKHVVRDPSVTVVHCTEFNRLMWDSNGVPTTVIDHGVLIPETQYQGTLDRGVVVINNIGPRGRRLGADIFDYVRQHVPIDLIGMGSTELGGLGEVMHDELPEFIAQYRFFFNPIRYTSLGLSIIEAMMVGLPIVGLATTELVTVIESGVNGFISLNPDVLIQNMRTLIDSPDLARELGENAKKTAFQRFSIQRFARDWEQLFQRLCAGEQPRQAFDMPSVSFRSGS